MIKSPSNVQQIYVKLMAVIVDKGYVFDEIKRICVLPNECPSKCTKPNEVFDECPKTCPPRICGVDERTIRCAAPPKPGDPACKPGCRCADNYYRNEQGTCVTKKQCKIKCNQNEVFDLCPAPCPPRRCGIDPALVLCAPSPTIGDPGCEPGCRCIDGYVRNDTDVCIPKEECQTCGGDPNARAGCGSNCNRKCSDIGANETKACTLACRVNACDCKDGYYLDENTGKCVLPNECPSICGPDEVYSDCTNGGCNAKNCTQLGRPVPCVKINSKNCKKGCICKEGYLRDENGLCVPEQSCPQSCNKPNEVYERCTFDCPPQTCDSLDKAYACPLQNNQTCVGKCKCKPGYYRNLIGECISEEDCRRCPGKHEYYSCGGACDNICDKLSEENQTSCSIINIKCNEMCYCEEGYARNKNNICVPFDQCNAPTCGKDEVYNDCIQGYCQPKNCSQIGKPVACPRIDPKKCIKGCLCKENYVRADNGTCIPKTDCQSCGGDNNARSGCGVNCNKRCSDIGKEPGACILICYDNACDCKDGFYLNENTGKCVKPNQCPRTCSKDEVYSECIEGQCQPKTCFDVGKPVTCPRIDPKKCTKGCLCKEDYVRVNNGTCIPKTECPSCGGDCNARAGCGVYCNRRCSDRGQEPKACTEICYDNACDCKPGFYLNEITGKCVPPNKCPPSCGRNEVYNSCVQGQCRPKSCSQLGKPLSCPRIDPKYCKGGCLCEDGYVKAKNGTCIPEKECPSCGGDPNAEAGCGINCNRRCSDVGKDPEVCEEDICAINGCDCKQGYYYDSTSSKCVLPDRCPTTNSSGNVDQSLEKLRRGNMALVGQFLWELYKMNPGQSFVTSPVSVLIPYGQLALYAVRETLDQLLKFINLDNKDQIKKAFPALLKNYRSQTSVLLTVAVKCYGNINYPFTDQFKNDAVTYFDSEGENIDFKYAKQAADTINGWVANKTNNLIQNLVSEDLFSDDTRLVLVDAIYLHGIWQNQFNPNNTHDRDFYITPNKTKSIKTMYQENFFNYGENEILDAQILELFYKGGNSSLVILLPKKKDGLPQMSHKLRNSDEFFNSIKSLRREKVKCFLPKMDIKTNIDMADLSQKMNVTKMFDPQSNDFEGILLNSDPVYVSAAIQKAQIIVDETGTEAAVATAVVGTTLSLPISEVEPLVFNADHPFVFVIKIGTDIIFGGIFAV